MPYNSYNRYSIQFDSNDNMFKRFEFIIFIDANDSITFRFIFDKIRIILDKIRIIFDTIQILFDENGHIICG